MKHAFIDLTVDGHVHTKLCHHARGEMEEYVQSAISKGLKKIIFLEHLEAGISYFESTWLAEDDFIFYHEEGNRLRDKYRGILEIGLGVEVGFNPDALDEIQRRLALHTWDRIGISYHFLATGSGHLNLVSRKQSNIDGLDRLGVDKVVEQYYQALLEAVEKISGQVLCHLDAVLRHHPCLEATAIHDDLIDRLLDSVAAKKMALEINTSGYRIKNGPYPSMDILRKAVKKNVPLTAGSDAHRPEDVGRDFDKLPALLEELVGSGQ